MKKIIFLIFLLGIWNSSLVFGDGTKNLLPRMPEIVIEKGYSDSFQVVECHGKTRLQNESAESVLKVVLKNISEKAVKSSLKIRILYLVSENSAQLSINGRTSKFDRKNPRILVSLNTNEEISIQISAKHNIQYNLDALKKETQDSSPLREPKKSKFGFGDFMRYFEKENFGRRFMVGPLVSKWGIFPVNFKSVNLEVIVPSDFEAFFPTGMIWRRKESSGFTVFSFEGTEGFSGAIFLPKKDLENFRKSQGSADLASSSQQ